MKEALIQKKIIAYLKTVQSGFFFKVPQGKYSLVGISDIIGVWTGRFCAIEVKAEGGVMTPLQQRFIELVKQHGGLGICVHSVEEVKQWIK